MQNCNFNSISIFFQFLVLASSFRRLVNFWFTHLSFFMHMSYAVAASCIAPTYKISTTPLGHGVFDWYDDPPQPTHLLALATCALSDACAYACTDSHHYFPSRFEYMYIHAAHICWPISINIFISPLFELCVFRYIMVSDSVLQMIPKGMMIQMKVKFDEYRLHNTVNIDAVGPKKNILTTVIDAVHKYLFWTQAYLSSGGGCCIDNLTVWTFLESGQWDDETLNQFHTRSRNRGAWRWTLTNSCGFCNGGSIARHHPLCVQCWVNQLKGSELSCRKSELSWAGNWADLSKNPHFRGCKHVFVRKLTATITRKISDEAWAELSWFHHNFQVCSITLCANII